MGCLPYCWRGRTIFQQKRKSPNTATKQELITDPDETLQNELCWRYPELGRALLELRVQPNEQVTAMRTDGESLYVNPEYLVHRFGENPENVYEEYLRLIRQCIEMPESFGKETEKQKTICKKWKEIAKELAITYGAGGKRRGENRGGQKEELSEIEKGKYDYRRFLRCFTVTREEMKLDQDAFDPVAYYYGWNAWEIFHDRASRNPEGEPAGGTGNCHRYLQIL